MEMVMPRGESRTTTVLLPSLTPRLPSQGSGTSNGRKLGKPNSLSCEVKEATGKVIHSKSKQHVFTHGFHRLQHFSCSSTVRYLMYSESTAAFISLHTDNTVCLYKADGHKQTPLLHSARFSFMGLTSTKVCGCLVGWGPGPVFTFLDKDLGPLDTAYDALDIRVCQAAEHSTDLVTAGVGNVCVWSVMLMRCKIKITEGLQHSTFTQMALATPRSDRPHRAFVVSGRVVTVVDLDAGKVLEHKEDLCSRDITAMVYCSHLDYLIIASQELSIRVWGPNWDLRVAFVGHNDIVNSLYYCSELKMLLSASVDCTIRCWDLEEEDVVECVHTEQSNPPLSIGGTRKGDTFFSFSKQGLDFWNIRSLYYLHCKLGSDKGVPLRQIRVSHFPAPFPTRVLCVSGDRDIALVAAETGAVLTSFKTEQRILCADYCLHKEILLVLTEAGTVLQGNTLTNPITLMQEWRGRGQGRWQRRDHVTEIDAQNLPVPGLACCLVLYSNVAETEGALEEWRSLQDKRGFSHRNKAAPDDAKNKFFIMLGQSGGCVSVLKLDDGKVLLRTPAHSGQRVTTLKVYPENGCLLSSGEDMTVTVWKVNPYVEECLSKQLSVHCGQPQYYLAALGPQLALTFQEPDNGTYSLTHFNLLNQSWTDHPPREGHLDHITGLCVCPDLEVFVSSSVDRTVRMWNEENRLIRTFQLNAMPECVAYSGFGAEMFLGIRGDLYRMSCAKFLPHYYQQMLLYTYSGEPLPNIPILKNEEKDNKRKTASRDTDEEEEVVGSNLLMTEDISRKKEDESVVTSNMDLTSLLLGTVTCKKEKPASTKETRREAFDCYMKIIYRLSPNVQVELEDTFDINTLPFVPKPYRKEPSKPPTLEKVVTPKLNIPVKVEKKCEVKEQECENIQSDIVSQSPPPQEKKVPVINSKPKTPIKVKPQPVPRVEKVIPEKPVIVEKEEEPQEIIPPKEKPKPILKPPALPTPPPPPPPPPHPPRSPEVPSFLKQFSEAGWFKDLYPDNKSVPGSLSPEDFSLKLLQYLKTSSAPSKTKIPAALQTLHSQGLIPTDELYQSIIDLVPKFARPQMSPMERATLGEMLNLLVHLKSVSHSLVMKLLTLLAYKELRLQKTILRILTALGVDEAEEWLWPELESWDSKLKDKSNIWKILHGKADSWLKSWTSKYKGIFDCDKKLEQVLKTERLSRYLMSFTVTLTPGHNQDRPLRCEATCESSTFTIADVLNYFCCVQKEEFKKARCVAPTGKKNTVLLPLYDCSYQPILRLGETYSMARIRRPSGIILPPLRSRPFLMHFPNFISLPLPRVTLYPFHICSEEDWLKALPHRFFIQQQSYVEYYR